LGYGALRCYAFNIRGGVGTVILTPEVQNSSVIK